MRSFLSCVDTELEAAPLSIDTLRRGREDLAKPIRCEGEMRLVRNRGQAFAAPPGKIGHDDVLSQMELRPNEDTPPAGTTETVVEQGRETLLL